MMRDTATYALIAIAGLAASGCGSSPTPTAPTPIPPIQQPALPPAVAQIAGAWTGSMVLTFQGGRIRLDTRTELQQSDRVVTGTWAVTTPDNDIRGEIRGTLAGLDRDTTFS